VVRVPAKAAPATGVRSPAPIITKIAVREVVRKPASGDTVGIGMMRLHLGWVAVTSYVLRMADTMLLR